LYLSGNFGCYHFINSGCIVATTPQLSTNPLTNYTIDYPLPTKLNIILFVVFFSGTAVIAVAIAIYYYIKKLTSKIPHVDVAFDKLTSTEDLNVKNDLR